MQRTTPQIEESVSRARRAGTLPAAFRLLADAVIERLSGAQTGYELIQEAHE